jgi:diaminopimelate epimerase
MNIEYYLADPAGNITALVTSPVLHGDYKTVAKVIMERQKSVEQVGFVTFSEKAVHLNMSGDEFCGNAAMSAAALYGALSGKSGRFQTGVYVFGTANPVKTAVTVKEGYFACECEIEKPKSLSEVTFCAQGGQYRFPIVHFEGISHIVADSSLSENAAAGAIKDIAGKLGVKALGIMILSGDKTRMKPIVYVPGVDTLFYENSCASGTCAAAAVLCRAGEKITLKQPGGEISAENADNIRLFSKVKISKLCSEEL